MRILECVPNISEGRDPEKISAIAETFKKHPEVKLLDVASDKDHNRTVFTFLGEPSRVREAAFSFAVKAIDLIDMRGHRGGHPRIGAVDVVPFVPIQGVKMAEAVEIARQFGKELGKRGVPVYFYEEAARSPERRDLPAIRKGEYEGLKEKLTDPAWKPDEGPSTFNARSGATVVGARFPLVAYNVNLKTEDLTLAKEIARKVRFKDGGFPCVRAMGVDLKDKGLVQVSMNLTNYQVTNIPVVYDFIREQARQRGVEVEASEIVGLIPMAALQGIVSRYIRCDSFSIRQIIEQRILESDRQG